MASKTCSSLAFFLTLNLIFFSLVSACNYGCPGSNPNPRPRPSPRPANPNPNPSSGSCPRDALKLGVCANVLNGLLNVTLGEPPVKPCCTLLNGLVDLEAAVCLCTALKANILGINLNLPISLSLLLNVCSKQVPRDFQCAWLSPIHHKLSWSTFASCLWLSNIALSYSIHLPLWDSCTCMMINILLFLWFSVYFMWS